MSIALVDRAALYGTGGSDQHVSSLLDKLDEVIAAVNVINVGEGVVLVADLAAAKALTAASGALDDKRLVLVESLGLYRCDTSDATAGDDVSVIRPTVWAATNGRLLRIAKLTLVHTHASDAEGSKLAQAYTHESADTDNATTSLHHTLGNGANAAAPGDHPHNGAAGKGLRLTEVSRALKTVHALADSPGVIAAADLLASNVMDATAMQAGRTYTLDTAAAIVAAFVGAGIGTDFEFLVYNPTAFTATIAVGANSTLHGSGAVAAGTIGKFHCKIDTITGNGAVTVSRLAEGTTGMVLGRIAGLKIVEYSAVIDAAAATDDLTCTGLAAVLAWSAPCLVDDPVQAEVTALTAVAGAAGHITVKGWKPTAVDNCTLVAGTGKAAVGTAYKIIAIGTP